MPGDLAAAVYIDDAFSIYRAFYIESSFTSGVDGGVLEQQNCVLSGPAYEGIMYLSLEDECIFVINLTKTR